MAWKSVKNLFSLDTTSNNASSNKKNANISSRIAPRPILSSSNNNNEQSSIKSKVDKTHDVDGTNSSFRTTDTISKPPSLSSSHAYSTNDIHQQLHDASELLYLHLPEDVKSVLDKLRALQNTEKSLIFDQKMVNGEWQNPFTTLEAAIMSLLIMAPRLLLVNTPKSTTPRGEGEDYFTRFSGVQDNLSSRPSSLIIQEEHYEEENTSNLFSPLNTLSVILENPHDQQRRNSHYSIRSHLSTSTFCSNLSMSQSKNSSLVKVLSASTLLTTVIGTILSMHNDALMNSFTESSMLDSYRSLHERISNEADAVLRYVRKITTQGKAEELSIHGQSIYDKLVVHSNRLVDSLNLLVNFVHVHLPILHEEPLGMAPLDVRENDPLTPEEKVYQKKKNTFKKKVMRSLSSFRRSSLGSKSKKSKSKNSASEDSDHSGHLSGRSSLTFERGRPLFSLHQTSADALRHNRKTRNESRDSSSVGSLASNASVVTAPAMYMRTRKIAFSEGSSLRRSDQPIMPRTRLRRKSSFLSIDTSHNSNVFQTDISSPSTVSSLSSSCRAYGGPLIPNHEPLSSPSKKSKFREQIDDPPSKFSTHFLEGNRNQDNLHSMDWNTPRSPRSLKTSMLSRMASTRRRLSHSSTESANSLFVYSHKISDSTTSLETRPTKNDEFEEKVDEIVSPTDTRPRKNSHSKIKSYFLKHIGSLSPVSSKGKKTSYWPVTEESESTSKKPTHGTSTLSGKQLKVHKNNSDTDLKSLQMMWAERDRLNANSVAHAEKSCEDAEEVIVPSTTEVSDANNLREQLFRKIVTKKSSTNLSVKKKSSLSSMIKISNVFTRLHEVKAVHSRCFQLISKVTKRNILQQGHNDSFSPDDGLLTDNVDGSPQIRASTLENLISRLADENEQDNEFIDCFVLSHVFFTSSKEFLESMIMKFTNNQGTLSTDTEAQTSSIQQKVLTVLDRWISLQPQNFQIEPELRNKLQEFLTDGVSNAGFRTDAEKIQKKLSDIPNIPSSLPLQQQQNTKDFSANPQKSLQKNSTLYDSSPLLEFSSKNIAKYLTLMDFNALKSITFFDFITVWWRKRQAFETDGSPNVAMQDQQFGLEENRLDAFTRRSNMLSHWIAHEICSLKTVKARRTILHKFIEAAKYCLEWNNFHTAMFIALALNSRPVRRLEKTWETLSHQALLNLQSIEELIDSSGNMRKYRTTLAQATPPIVPFFATFLKDITFIMEGNNTFLPTGHKREKQFRTSSMSTTPTLEHNIESQELSARSSTPTSEPHSDTSNTLFKEPQPLINFEKFLLLKKNVYNITRYTSKSYPFENQLSSHSFKSIYQTTPSKTTENIQDKIISNNSDSNIGDSKTTSTLLDYIGEVIENRIFEAAGAIFGGNVASIAMSDGGELEAELMALSLEAEPIAQQ
ncbi:12148_t:CDS:10 [Acaulospora morrowiae]|uniref:12148_t:CDS:1 n=1 Tax=Acaulospora morrowiae TaxID=94023 RepID=A0A9N9FIG4_9GLOM|nr:12148_t:CDS:10 [Acaulospora morrowiae]